MTGGGQYKDKVVDPSGGANQSRVRAYNERLVMSLVRRHGSLPKAQIARRSGLSAQTVSVIMRSLEADGLLLRGEPQRGRVGQPSIPMSLNPEGAFSIGLKIGRRSSDLILVDFLGRTRRFMHHAYDYPLPEQVLEFSANGIAAIIDDLMPEHAQRIAGIGIAIPFELWNWADKIGASRQEMDAWHSFDLQAELEKRFDYPVLLQNDATSACGAELVFGRGTEFSDFGYFFVGTFIGGGIVLNHSLYSGRTGNAGALGPMPVPGSDGRPVQLLDTASIFQFENQLKARGIDASPLWLSPDDWGPLTAEAGTWIRQTGRSIALAVVSLCSVIDFEAVIIDGAFPVEIRQKLVGSVISELSHIDLQGIDVPTVVEGMVGSNARAIGAASLPLFARYLVDQNVVFKETVQAAE